MEFIATQHFCNIGGIGIYSIDPASDTIYTAFWFGGKEQNARRTNIYYTAAGRAYFRRYNRRYYLDEFMRTGAPV